MQTDLSTPPHNTPISFDEFKSQVLRDFRIATISRQCSLMGRREVLTGKAKFGIFGDGKELPQLAWARVFKNGDFRSGYYRDQTFMFAINKLEISHFFAGLYAYTDIKEEPFSAGRQMGGHFVTHSLDANGEWNNLMEQPNSSCDLSPTAGQIPRLLGLAQASKIYKDNSDLSNFTNFSNKGNEVAWGTIGNASTSEGLFFETINAAGVLQVPMIISVWDDDYGISVHNEHHTTKQSISKVLQGFHPEKDLPGVHILSVKGWDYIALIDTYEKAEKIARNSHEPVVIHVTELTQPQGHSTSGSHERYKSEARLEWEKEYDCLKKFEEFIVSNKIATPEELREIQRDIKREVREEKNKIWKKFISGIIDEKQEAINIYKNVANSDTDNINFINNIINTLEHNSQPIRKDIIESARKILRYLIHDDSEEKKQLIEWLNNYQEKLKPKYSSHLYDEGDKAAHNIDEVPATYDHNAPMVDARIVLRDNFDKIFEKYPETLIFGEDTGKIGDVNQGLEGLQEKYGELRVADTGIREPTIIGQGIGMALRGLRPITEIQYLDYILYCLQTLSDDLASLRYRSFNRQIAPVIIRTRGHRLEGIWHSGSPMGGIINLMRGILILVPRNMTKAAGFYNTLLKSNESALVIECLNGYRLKERLPDNLGEFTVPIGQVEIIQEGNDITVISYGSTLRLVQQAAIELSSIGIEIEIIDIQSLLPFDLDHTCAKSISKTNRVLIVDEDMPGGASGYILQQLLDEQAIFQYLDSAPQTLSAQPHRPAFGSDGDYFSKPSTDDIFEKIYQIIHEANPKQYPKLR